MSIFKFFLACLISSQASAADIFINRLGYHTDLPKYFYYPDYADSFYVIEKLSGAVFYSGKIILSIENDPATGLTLYSGDFSGLRREGLYFIKLNNGDMSSVIEISSTIFNDAFRKSLKSFFFQRCGFELTGQYAGQYQRPACHLNDGVLHTSTGDTGYAEVTGGWHDAGDYGKYVVNAGITVGTLLMAYEYFPERFNSDNLNIPESGNNIPDILDEVKFELLWLLKMQRQDGGVYFKLTRENFEGFVMPEQDDAIRYIYEVSSTATADFAAVMARASRVFGSIDSSFAGQCLNASVLAWKFLSAHPEIIPTGGFRNPSGTNTGSYGDKDDSDERLWASAELFESTGNSEYHDFFINHDNYSENIKSAMYWGNVRNLACITYLHSIQSSALNNIKEQIEKSLAAYGDSLARRSENNGFGVTINPGEYHWGCNSDALNNAILLILAFERSGGDDFLKKALMQLNYILGINAFNMSFVSGVGSKSVMNLHHRPSASDGITDPVPGLIAGGPNQFLQDNLLKTSFTDSTPPALCYIDDTASYASNENAINWNAPLVFVLGYFNSRMTGD